MKLNSEKIIKKLKKMERSRSWLARQCGVDRELVYYWLRVGSLKGAEPIGKILRIKPKDLIL